MLDESFENAPRPPIRIEDTGLDPIFMRDILIKTIFRKSIETVTAFSNSLKVAAPVVESLIEIARSSLMIEVLGRLGPSGASELRYQLTDSGKARAIDALSQTEYYGALPVPLAAYWKQTRKQAIREARISRERLESSMSHLVLPHGLLDQLGPAVNSGRSILLYGPPGNGKSSIANGIRDSLGDKIFVPRALEHGGQIISVYDPLVHTRAEEDTDDPDMLRRTGTRFDNRYVYCRRPSVMTGGELTLSMLDIAYNPASRTYQAPLQLKATGGVFIVDDLGRQSEPPQALINRWIVPMESHYDILSLQSGEKFMVPFDTLVIFSTNMTPSEMFDGAALRRVYYKIKIDKPSRDEFIKIFMKTAKHYDIKPDEEMIIHLLRDKYPEVDNMYASYHAPFLIDQMLSICEYEGLSPQMSRELVDRAWANLFLDEG